MKKSLLGLSGNRFRKLVPLILGVKYVAAQKKTPSSGPQQIRIAQALITCLFQLHGDGPFRAKMGAKAAALAVIKIDDGLMSRFVLGDGLIRTHELADLAPLARPRGKAAHGLGLCAFGIKRWTGWHRPNFLGG